jgi:hypothetical protein
MLTVASCRCLLGVDRVTSAVSRPLPVYLDQPTFSKFVRMSPSPAKASACAIRPTCASRRDGTRNSCLASDFASPATAALCSRTHLPDGQFPHARHAQIARRANLSHMFALAPSGKSRRCSRASRLDEEGRFGRSSRYVGRGCGGRGGHVRRTWPKADGEVVWFWRSEAGAKVAGFVLRTTVATKQWSPGRARYKP